MDYPTMLSLPCTRAWRQSAWRFVAISIVCLYPAGGALAQTSYNADFPTATLASWQVPDNWDPVGVPGTNSGDTVTITQAESDKISELTLSDHVTIASFNKTGGVSTFRISPSTTITGGTNFSATTISATGLLTFWNTSTAGRSINVLADSFTVNYVFGASVNFGSSSAANRVGAVTIDSDTSVAGTISFMNTFSTDSDGVNINMGNVSLTAATADIRIGSVNNTGVVNTIQFGSLSGTSGTVRTSEVAQSNTAVLLISGNTNATFSGTLSNGASGNILSLRKQGGNTQTLGGSNITYTGSTVVSGGTLLINGTHSQSSNALGAGDAADGIYRIAIGGTLGGTGRIQGRSDEADTNMVLVQSGGILAPGASIGTLTLDGANISGADSTILNMASGAEFNFELAGDGSSADRISFWNYAGAADFVRNDNKINLSLLGAPDPGTYTVVLFDFFLDGGSTATASGISNGLTLTGATIDPNISSATLLFNTNNISLEYEVIPEPRAWALLGMGLVAVIARLRSRRK